ncbi:MAG: ran GTPase activating protein 1 [Amphiamblys sp. WSBS2006]|nr:MAG: ran GTPase activating protein 1 [Amphiamblys sp. WSBS2006]
MGIGGSKAEMPPTVLSFKNEKKVFEGPESYRDALGKVQEAENIGAVCLSGNTFGVGASKAFSDGLERHRDIEDIDISDVFTGRLRAEIPQSVGSFASLMCGLPRLRVVNVSDNAFGPDCVIHMEGFLSGAASLETLRMQNCGLGPEGGRIVANALLRLGEAASKPCLRELILGRNRLEDGSCAEFGKVFEAHPLLELVAMPQNGIRPDGSVLLLAGLSSCKNLQTLDIQDNTLSGAGGDKLCEALPGWPGLEYLDVGDCMLPGRSSKHIVELLRTVFSEEGRLVYLGLHYSEVSEETAMALCGVLPSFPRLHSLKLNGNCFEKDGAAGREIRRTFEECCYSAGPGVDEWDDFDSE